MACSTWHSASKGLWCAQAAAAHAGAWLGVSDAPSLALSIFFPAGTAPAWASAWAPSSSCCTASERLAPPRPQSSRWVGWWVLCWLLLVGVWPARPPACCLRVLPAHDKYVPAHDARRSSAVAASHKRPLLKSAHTPQMKDGDELTAVPEGGDSRRQMAELGPLFATVFGSKAAAAAGAGAKPEMI